MAAPLETKVRITGDASSAVAAVGKLRGELGALQSVSAKAFAFGGALGGTAAVAWLTSITKQVIDTGDALAKMSQKTGVSVEELGRLQYAAGLSGASAEDLGRGLQKIAVEAAAAATGSAKSVKLFGDMGISLRNTDGTLRSSGEILKDLADKFQAMPDGVGKTSLAVDIFGEKLAARMIPLLNSGRDGLKAMGDEAEALGAIIGTDMAKQSEAFNDNLSRMQTLSSKAGIVVGNALLPALNDLLATFLDFSKSPVTLADMVFGVGFADKSKTAAQQVDLIGKKIADLRAKQKAARDGDAIDIQYEIDQQERLLDYFRKRSGVASDSEIAIEAAKTAAKRIGLQTDLQTKLAALEQLRAIAAGKVSADILLDDKHRTDEQIKNAEKLRDALRTAWNDSLEGAKKAGEEAKTLLAKAAGTRQSGADKARDARLSALSESDQAAINLRDYRSNLDTATNQSLLAKFAAQQGRSANAARLADEATAAADRAEKLADKLVDPEERARAFEKIAEAQATADEARAKNKQTEAKALEETAAEQVAKINELDAQITQLQAHAAAVAVQVQIDEAQAAIVQIKAELDAIPNKTVYVDVVSRSGGGAIAAANADAVPRFFRGGWTGPGSKYQAAGIVDADEVVIRKEIVRQPGMLELLLKINQLGLAALPRYASGGLVSNIRPGSLQAPSHRLGAARAIFNFPDLGRYPVTMDSDLLGKLQTAFAREALARGGRR